MKSVPETRTDLAPGAGQNLLLGFVLLSAIGLSASIYLSVIHWQLYNVPGHVSFCAINEKVNCDTVSMSKYSMVAGVPTSTWGILFYLALTVVGVWGIFRDRPPWSWGLLGLLSVASLGLSAYLFLISDVVIQALCIMCIILYAVNLINWVLAAFAQRRTGGAALGLASWALLTTGLGTGLFAAFFGEYGGGLFWLLPAALLAGAGALAIRGRCQGERAILRQAWGDLTSFFQKPVLGAALAVLALALLSATWLLVPRLYPTEQSTIAGGLEGLDSGLTEGGHNWIGAKSPELVITEYSDYECPYCRAAHMVVREAVRERKDWLRLVHVHVPLDHTCNSMLQRPMHRNACDCARAAICAERQGRFWPMNDALFLRQGGLDAQGLTMLAERMGLDAHQFRGCMKAEATEATLQANLGECKALAEECEKMGRGFGTPTFVVGKEMVVGVKPKAWWDQFLTQQRAKGKPPQASSQ